MHSTDDPISRSAKAILPRRGWCGGFVYVLSSLEGAILLSRAEKSVAPLERAASLVVPAVRARLQAARAAGRR